MDLVTVSDDIINNVEDYDTMILLDLLVIKRKVSECEDKIRDTINNKKGG